MPDALLLPTYGLFNVSYRFFIAFMSSLFSVFIIPPVLHQREEQQKGHISPFMLAFALIYQRTFLSHHQLVSLAFSS